METIADILREVDDRAAAMPDAYSGLAEYLSQVRDRIDAAHRREVADLRRRLKLAEDALENLQSRLVASVHDGTIDPHEALEIAERALAAIREEGAKDDE